MSNYVLESDQEFARLEKQSSNESYDYKKELEHFRPKKKGRILDAGCGSGVVSRYLGALYPESQVMGCDASDVRLQQAKKLAQGLSNVEFKTENLQALTFPSQSFDAIICRYVIEHLPQGVPEKVFAELHRCLKPGGLLYVIDVDGVLFNLFPSTPFLNEGFKKIQEDASIDLYVGRKLAHYFRKTGFSEIEWKIETLQFTSDKISLETELMIERFNAITPFLKRVLNGAKNAQKFTQQYLECLQSPDAVLFYNKFIVTGKKKNKMTLVP